MRTKADGTVKGYERTAGRRNGGISRLALAPLDSVVSVTFDRRTGNAESIEMAEGEHFALYRFCEDSAWFTERVRTQAGFSVVERELGFTLERLDRNQREAVMELIGKSVPGLVAIAYNGCGTAHLLGMNHRDGRYFPLKVKNTELLTGKSPADLSGETVILHNTDTARAPLFTGPSIFQNE